MAKFYVTMTWDNWPEGGSYGEIIEAENDHEAEASCRQMMAESRAGDPDDKDYDAEFDSPEYYLEAYADEWEIVDCYDIENQVDAWIASGMIGLPKVAKDLLVALKDLVRIIDTPTVDVNHYDTSHVNALIGKLEG